MPISLPVETYHSGQGGHAVPSTGIGYPVAEWSVDKRARLADSTTSASGGEHRTRVLRGGTFRINVPWNSVLTPEDAGFREGDELDALCLYLGDSLLMYQFPAIMEQVSVVVNAANDIIRLTISGYSQGGIPDPVAVPA